MLLSAQHLGLRDGRRVILSEVSLSIAAGQILTIVGPNGSGKSTLLRLLIGARTPTTGKVIRQPGLIIGYMPQKLAIDRGMPLTLWRFLTLAGGADPSEVMDRVGLAGLQHTQMADLSGGEFQRALLARALLRKPQLLILDEPTQGLDQPGAAGFYALLETLRQETGCAVLMVSHDLHVVMKTADRVICLNQHICCEGTPTAVAGHPEYRALFDPQGEGLLALYRHQHDHSHDHALHHHHHRAQP